MAVKSLFLVFLTILPLSAGTGDKIVAAARKQIGVTTAYVPDYVTLDYPNGDVPEDGGVCTDVVIRALRDGLAKDLQKLVHEDMATGFSAYPKIWGLKRPDKNIDHRRVPNLMTFFKRKGYQIPVPDPVDWAEFLPGDIVTCIVGANLPHVMIVSDKKSDGDMPLVIHNIGGGAQEEDCLAMFKITGHYRLK